MNRQRDSLWSLEDVIKATGGELILKGKPETSFKGVETDSRKMCENSIFVALKGERFDGHDFLKEAFEKGAQCLIVDKPLESFEAGRVLLSLREKGEKLPTVIKVGDTLRALGDLARYKRSRFVGPVIGITGSNGKTSTKEMIACVLEGSFEVLKNPLNWNNNVGLPLSLLQLEPHHTAVVLEMGINHPGEMDQLVEIARPSVGVITNIQKAHLEGLESEDKICYEKTKLWRFLPKGKGCAVVNGDDPRLVKASRSLRDISIIYFGIKEPCDVTVEGDIQCSRYGTSFVVRHGYDRARVMLPVLGEHFAMNALSAIAVGLYLNISLEVVSERLSSWKPVSHRMECMTLPDGSVIVDDSYNANPGSMLRAIDTVFRMAQIEKKPFIAVLGDMKELGVEAEELHRFIGRELAARSPTALFTLGELARFIADEGREAGIPTVVEATDHTMLLEALAEHWVPGAWLLVKGSRSMKMEQIVEGLVTDART